MLNVGPGRKPSLSRGIALAALLAAAVPSAPALAADGLWDSVMEKMNLKAEPPGPAPDFVEKTRPDSADLGYMPTALPHKVSPLPVKSADQIQAAKAALDAAKARQLAPAAPRSLQAARGARPARSAPAAD